jgi:hypothetical protein
MCMLKRRSASVTCCVLSYCKYPKDHTERSVLIWTLVLTGLWVGDCFIYTNGAWRLNYCVGGEVTTMFHLDRPMYLLGYLASQSKVYLIDKVSTLTTPP